MVVHYGPPESPDNKSIRAQLEELKKLNSSTTTYSKIIIAIGTATILASIAGLIAVLWE